MVDEQGLAPPFSGHLLKEKEEEEKKTEQNEWMMHLYPYIHIYNLIRIQGYNLTSSYGFTVIVTSASDLGLQFNV